MLNIELPTTVLFTLKVMNISCQYIDSHWPEIAKLNDLIMENTVLNT